VEKLTVEEVEKLVADGKVPEWVLSCDSDEANRLLAIEDERPLTEKEEKELFVALGGNEKVLKEGDKRLTELMVTTIRGLSEEKENQQPV
tara:strand:- start:893 stop:1162 length:270 start_codon:yes stop_codon:yes gene_type:complete